MQRLHTLDLQLMRTRYVLSCTDKGSVVDNRDKKSDPKFSKIPDFACQKAPYGSGCGWAAWSGNESIPSEWI